MSACYTVIQYLPDPATDERINFGVVTFNGHGEIHARFVRNWHRVDAFGGIPESRFLRGFARELEEATSAQGTLPLNDGRLDGDALAFMVGNWKNSIQFTQPRASTLSAVELIDEVAGRFLKERVTQPRRRDRRAAAGSASRNLAEALRSLGSRNPARYVSRDIVVVGRRDEHSFDVALANGEVRLGVLAMSFEGESTAELAREIRANAWTVDDVREESPDFPISVVALPPRSGASKAYEHAIELFGSLNADVVPERQVAAWADRVAADLYPDLVASRR